MVFCSLNSIFALEKAKTILKTAMNNDVFESISQGVDGAYDEEN